MNAKHNSISCQCSCCRAAVNSIPLEEGVSRRQFLVGVGALTVGGMTLTSMEGLAGADPLPERRARIIKPLKVQPVLTYATPKRREATSWREWGGIQTEQDAAAEKARIESELRRMAEGADFRMEMLPLATARNVAEAAAIAKGDHDVVVIYAAGGGGQILEALTGPGRWSLMFLRHDPGPVYLWYEIVHPRFLRKTVDEYAKTGMDVQDVVVDKPSELLWRLRALYGLKNTLGKRMVAVGGASGWGAGGQKAPEIARAQFKMDLVDYPYAKLEPRLQQAMQNASLVESCREQARKYLKQRGTTLQTTRAFVDNAFVLLEVFKDVMEEYETDAITINSCMGTIMPMSRTTACLPLSLLNDEGYLAFCESDFVVIPSGVLLHYISGKPVFLNDPTYPHDQVVTLAHCTAPRKMDGKRNEPTKILTHFESDYGAAPKVEMKIGQKVTNLVPDFASQKWVGFDGTIVGNPFLDICRSQIEVRIDGDMTALLEEMKGFHWMTCYGSYLQETGYALKKVGATLLNVSAT